MRPIGFSITIASLFLSGLAAVVSCAQKNQSNTAAPSSPTLAGTTLQDRIARSMIAASPVTDASDVAARDAAADKLGRCTDLINAPGEAVLWGGYDEKKGYDPAAYKLTWFSPLIWAKLYLSTLMYTGEYHIRQEGKYTVLELAAKFRDSLDAGEYPYPFWHSPAKWQAYLDTAAVLLVFEGDKIIASYRKVIHDPAKPLANKMWDGKWHWIDAQGNEQPRTSLYTYALSSDNPHRATLDTAYRKLEEKFRGQNCIGCHSPDNTAQASTLTMLCYPNQALAGRHSIVSILKEDKMPPLDKETGKPAGLHNDAVRDELIQLALTFEQEADAALKFEASRNSR